MVVNILGTEYTIEVVKISECDILKENGWCGECNKTLHIIRIGDASEEEYYGKLSEKEQQIVINETLRHEIIHAFLNESGLASDSFRYDKAWATNEEMVDWFALQFPKIQKVFEEVGCNN